MSYDLAVWEEPRPRSSQDAVEVFAELSDRAEIEALPPSPRIRAFVEALAARFPEDGDGPWTTVPVLDGASGGFLYLTLAFEAVEQVAGHVGGLAEEHGLVCFDPQLECLLPSNTNVSVGPDAEETVASWIEAPVSRDDAVKTLRMPRSKLDLFADRLEVAGSLDLAALLTIQLLATDDLHPPERWREAARELRRWLATPDGDDGTSSMLAVDDNSARVVGDRVAVTPRRSHQGPSAMYAIDGALSELLDRLARLG